MYTRLQCLSCIFSQCCNIIHDGTTDESQRREMVREVLNILNKSDFSMAPARVSGYCYDYITKTLKKDNYKDLKKEYNRNAMEIYPVLKKLIQESDNKLKTAVKCACSGNAIDLGILLQGSKPLEFDVKSAVMETVSKPFAIDEFDLFEKTLNEVLNIKTHKPFILFLGDNTGEIVFDKLLIETIGHYDKFLYVVRESPVLNDATMEDAEEIGLTKMVRVISNGQKVSHPGTVIEECSKEFLDAFWKADMVISKGQGNFECLTNRVKKKNLFYILKAKCKVITEELKCELNGMIVKHQPL